MIWATGAGVLRVDAQTLARTVGYESWTLRAVVVDPSGQLWVTAGPAVFRDHPASFPAVRPRVVVEHPNWASDLDIRGDTLWLGSYGDGLIRYVGGVARDTIGVAEGLGTNMVEGLHRTSQGLWALTRSAGAALVHKGRVERLSREDGLPSSAVFSLFEARDGVVWVGTDRGLGRWDGRHATALGTDALVGQRVTALFEREATPGVIWAVGDRHLYRVRGALPAIVLMDIEMPGRDGIETTAEMKRSWPDIEVLMQTVFEDEDKIFAAVQAGASGYLLKDAGPDAIVRALGEIADGGAPTSPLVARKLVDYVRRLTAARAADAEAIALTPRETDVLERLVEDDTEAAIADDLGVSPHTVRTHVKNLYAKLQVHSRAQMIRAAMRRGLV